MNLQFYNAYITFNGQKTTIPFFEILDGIFTLHAPQKYKEIKNTGFSLIQMKIPTQNYNDVNDRVVCFAHYRDGQKPYLGSKRSDRMDEIADDVIEKTTAVFQYTNKLFICEYNHYGAKPKNIENYLSTFLPKQENNEWGVTLVEVEPNIGIEDVRDSNDIRQVEFKLNLSTHQRNRFFINTVPDSVLGNLFRDTLRIQEKVGGNIAKITFGSGRKKSNRLDSQGIIDFINLLDLDSDLYESVKVRYFSNQLNSLYELDLKNAGVLKRSIEPEGTSWEIIGDNIQQEFYDHGRPGEGRYTRFQNSLIVVEKLPSLVIDTTVIVK
ncbi:hypothetical protein A9985_07100 [Bacillus safensis]|uniref:DUF6731 family protein n=1 Tax=Bacillus TaxID=1386 RepID=UPI0007FB3B39|nr:MULTISPECIES: DUF6731 family protein [Bacillus]MDH6561716.1 hypothetical protein [Bacillus sp. TBS-096]OBW52087.1 hypothetical protein A9985_07100 [Bacillus safensis]RAU59525.1 hypothetical protein BSAJGB5T_02110 [Bacillus safensis]